MIIGKKFHFQWNKKRRHSFHGTKEAENLLQDAEIKHLIQMLRRYCYSLTGGFNSDIDDLVQQTLEVIVSKPVPTEVKISTWAYKVCTNMWIDNYRKRKHELISEVSTESLIDPVNEENVMQDKLFLQQVKHAMKQLSLEHRQILALVTLNGLSYQEISDVLDLPIGTVMSRLARARNQLTQQLLMAQKGADK